MNANNNPSFAFIRVYSRIRSVILVLPLLAALLPAVGNSNAANRAGVVIRYADGTVRTSCVSFDQPSISGLELLQRADTEVIAQPAPGNAAVCKIGADGCDYPAEPCFCRFGAGNSREYWAYWQLDGGSWRYGQQGAGARRVVNGDVDGWAYGSGSVESGVQPPIVTFDELCPVASAARQSGATASLEAVAPPASQAPTPARASVAQASSLPSAAAGAAPAAGESSGTQPASDWGGYLVFAAMLAGVLGTIAVALRRRGAA